MTVCTVLGSDVAPATCVARWSFLLSAFFATHVTREMPRLACLATSNVAAATAYVACPFRHAKPTLRVLRYGCCEVAVPRPEFTGLESEREIDLNDSRFLRHQNRSRNG